MRNWKRGAAWGLLSIGAPLLAVANGQSSDLRADPIMLAAKADDEPLSREALFDLEPVKEKVAIPSGAGKDIPSTADALFDLPAMKEPGRTNEGPIPESKEALFGELPAQTRKEEKVESGWHGFFQGEAARTYADPEHWSKLIGRVEVGTHGRLDNGAQWKISGRLDYNAVYDINDFYAPAVRKDQRAEFHLRENYLDFSSGDWEFRLGRQHIVWGEMVGLFFADVVSAKDLREFILQDFQLMRIPQWAARAEYFRDDFHAELIWVPFPSYDEIGKPGTLAQQGSEFFGYPVSPGSPNVLGSRKPGNNLTNTNYGLRLSRLVSGWDMSGFLYSSMDSSPTYYLVGNPSPGVYSYLGRHERIHQTGATLAKDFGVFVLKAEAIYTGGRRYNVAVDDAIRYTDGVVKQNTLDWVLGLDFHPGPDTRLNTQFFQRVYFNHDKNIIPSHLENGFSLLVNHKFTDALEAEALLVRSLNRSDWMLRPKLNWSFERNWRLSLGIDIFSGPSAGIFGQFDDKDRAYTELRYDF
jgi:hypothetical protein